MASSRTSSPLEVRIPYPIPPQKLDADAVDIVRRLVHYGHEAYLVGGCIRDVHEGLPPKDFDLVTSARPNQIKKIFRNSRIIGRRFRLAHIHVHGKIIEVSTFRGMDPDAESLGGRSTAFQDNVFGTAEEDAMRRDFTINGLYYDVDSEEIIDYVGGFSDLRRGIIRCIGDPELRLEEDPVRMIRALKLAAKIDFRIDPPLDNAIREHRRMIRESSPARILEELFKILGSGSAARTFELLHEYRVLENLLPEVARAIPAGDDNLYRFLDALDAADRGLRIHSNPVLLGALFLPILDPRGKAIGLYSPKPTRPDGPLRIEPDEPDSFFPEDRDFRAPTHLQLSLDASRLVRNSAILRNLPRRELHQLGQILALQRRLATATGSQVTRLTHKAGFEDAVRLFDIACAALGAEPATLPLWRPYLERAPRPLARRDEPWRPGFAESDVDELDFDVQFDEEDAELADMLFPNDSGRPRRRGRRRQR